MARPRPGDVMVHLAAVDDGVLVESAQVRSVTSVSGSWSDTSVLRVETDKGTFLTDTDGVGSELVPLDDELNRQLQLRGNGFVIEPTEVDIDLGHEESHGYER